MGFRSVLCLFACLPTGMPFVFFADVVDDAAAAAKVANLTAVIANLTAITANLTSANELLHEQLSDLVDNVAQVQANCTADAANVTAQLGELADEKDAQVADLQVRTYAGSGCMLYNHVRVECGDDDCESLKGE